MMTVCGTCGRTFPQCDDWPRFNNGLPVCDVCWFHLIDIDRVSGLVMIERRPNHKPRR